MLIAAVAKALRALCLLLTFDFVMLCKVSSIPVNSGLTSFTGNFISMIAIIISLLNVPVLYGCVFYVISVHVHAYKVNRVQVAIIGNRGIVEVFVSNV